MDDATKKALETDRVIDITTTGRKSGEPRRIEIWFHNVDGRVYITGTPGKRAWHANLRANPAMTFHLKQSVQADLLATARIITAEPERRELLARIVATLDGDRDLEDWVRRAPLLEVVFAD